MRKACASLQPRPSVKPKGHIARQIANETRFAFNGKQRLHAIMTDMQAPMNGKRRAAMDRLHRREDRSHRAGNLQSAERVVVGLLQRDPADTACHAIGRRACQFLVTNTGSGSGASANTATGGGGTALRWSSSSRMNAAPAAVSLNSQRLFFTPSKMRE